MPKTILLTAAKEDSEQVISLLTDKGTNVIHTPLEVYVAKADSPEVSEVFNHLESFENIVHSSIRNAQFFLTQVQRYNKLDDVKDCLNLTFNEATFSFLEEQGIPAVKPPNGNKPIDLVELMLRLQRMGTTLYPCGSHQPEDFPGFLKELEMEVTELDVFDLEGPSDETLSAHQKEVGENRIDTIIFHSRRSVNRTMAAFSDLAYGKMKIISADKGITDKLQKHNISVDAEAEGNWESVADLI